LWACRSVWDDIIRVIIDVRPQWEWEEVMVVVPAVSGRLDGRRTSCCWDCTCCRVCCCWSCRRKRTCPVDRFDLVGVDVIRVVVEVSVGLVAVVAAVQLLRAVVFVVVREVFVGWSLMLDGQLLKVAAILRFGAGQQTATLPPQTEQIAHGAVIALVGRLPVLVVEVGDVVVAPPGPT
jgi:hypothetical protein